MGELGGRIVFVGGVIGVGIGVRVDMQGDQGLVAFGHRTHDRHGDRTIAANGDGDRTAFHDAAGRLLDALEGIENAARREFDVATVNHIEGSDRIKVGVRRVVAADQGRLQPHGVRTTARTNAKGMRPTVERQPQDRRAIGRTRPPIRHAHEGQG